MMQKGIRVYECQLTHLAQKAKHENNLCGYLFKKSADTGKWQLRWFALYQNLLFYYENESASKPSGVCLLEGCYCERVVTPSKGKDGEKQVSHVGWVFDLCLSVCYVLAVLCETQFRARVWNDISASKPLVNHSLYGV